MVRRKHLFVVFLLCVSVTGGGAQSQGHEKTVIIEGLHILIPTSDEIVDYRVWRESKVTLVSLLVQDMDEVIKCYRVRHINVDDQERGQLTFLGYATKVCDPVLASLLPTKQVPIRIIRSSCVSQGREYIGIVTLGWSKAAVDDIPHYSIYVFERQSDHLRQAFTVGDAGLNLMHFIFRDLNGSCRPEIIDVSRPSHISFLNVRTVKPDGQVELVQRLEASEILISESALDEVRVIEKDRSGNTFLFWSRAQGKFVARSDSTVVPNR